MMAIAYTGHAEARMQQRGIRSGDVTLIVECGTQIDDETWLMRDRDVEREIDGRKPAARDEPGEIERRRREIQALGRLKSTKVVMRGEQVITAYPSRPNDRKRTLRRGRRKGLAT